LARDIENLREPREPDPDECCGSGCFPCVLDVYYDALEKYELKRAELEEKMESDSRAIELQYEEEEEV